jgi:hypothetical protein
VGDQLRGRRSDFHTGKGIRLADGQVWTFPAPAEQGSSSSGPAFGPDYFELIRAILEAEDSSEGRLAELALAMFLLGHKHPLASAEYQRLFMFEPNSPELADSQSAFHDLARDHVEYLVATGLFSRSTRAGKNSPGAFARFLNRLRNHWPIRGWYPTSRKSEVLS